MEFELRKRKVSLLNITEMNEEKIPKFNPQFNSFKNVFLITNNKPFFESNRVLPIIRNVGENNNNPNCRYYKHSIQYMPCNAILCEKYIMENEIVFSISMGNEELIIPRVRKSKDKIRNVYVNGIKRIESKYNKDGIQYELNCFSENGRNILFRRKMETNYDVNTYVSYKYDENGNVVKKWIE